MKNLHNTVSDHLIIEQVKNISQMTVWQFIRNFKCLIDPSLRVHEHTISDCPVSLLHI